MDPKTGVSNLMDIVTSVSLGVGTVGAVVLQVVDGGHLSFSFDFCDFR